MRGHRESHRKQTLTFTGTGVATAALQRAPRLGWSGRIVRVVTRMSAGGLATVCDIRVVNGVYTEATSPASVPDEDVAYLETGITLAGSATAADQDTNVAAAAAGAHYAARHDDELVLVSVDVTAATGAWEIQVTIYTDEVE